MEGKQILVVLDVQERHKKLLESGYPEATFIYCSRDYDSYLPEAQIIIGNIPPEKLKLAKKLEWIQTNNAGVDQFIGEGIVPSNVTMTCASGAYGLAISEYMLGCTLSLLKKLNQYHINQSKHEWKDMGYVSSIYGSRTLVVGMGDIGSEFGKKMHLLGSTVYGIRRHIENKPEWVDELFTMDQIDDILGKADIVALCLPKTPQTNHIINLQRMEKMKKTAILLNIGRGNAVVTEDLVKALNQGIIFGAAVDVTDPEPLPPEHPLWEAKNIIITPHTSGQYHLPETFERIIRLSAKNLALYRVDKPLKSQVDFTSGYKRFEG